MIWVGHFPLVTHFVYILYITCIATLGVAGHQPFPRSKRAEIQKDFVAITKLDVSMNSLLVRAKFFSLICQLYILPSVVQIFHQILKEIPLPPHPPTGLRGMKAASGAASSVGSEGPKAKAQPKPKKAKAVKSKAAPQKNKAKDAQWTLPAFRGTTTC